MIATMLHQTAQVSNVTDQGLYGPLYGDPVAVKARIEPARRTRKTREGLDYVYIAKGYFLADAPLVTGSRVTHAGLAYVVLELVPVAGPFGATSHIEAVMQLGNER